MNRFPVREPDVAVAGLLAVFATACGSSDDDAPAGATAAQRQADRRRLYPHDVKAPAGPINFEVENDGSGLGHRDGGARRRNDPR